jgi:hypothetical protein
MTRPARGVAVALGAILAGCGDTTTSVRLEITAAPSLTLDGLAVTVAGTRHDEAMTESLQLLVPDSWAGVAQRIAVDGTRRGAVVAAGAIVVTPIAGREIVAQVTLVDASCDLICNLGEVDCDGDAVVTCELGMDGCPSWGAAGACPAATPFCSSGTCSEICADDCTAGATKCEGSAGERTCGQTDSDACLDWGPPVTCAAAPAPSCVDSSTLRTYDAGTCIVTGACAYTPHDTVCPGGCTAGACGHRKADLIVATTTGTFVGLSTGTSFATLTSWSPDSVNAMDVSDVNGDGKADLILATTTGTLVGLSTGTSFAALTTWSTASINAMDVADVNGDGKADLVLPTTTGTLVGLSTGTSFAALAMWTTTSINAMQVADVNGDGKADLVIPTTTGTKVGLSTGTSFAAPTTWSTASINAMSVADVDGN